MNEEEFQRLVENFKTSQKDIKNNDALFSELRRRNLLTPDAESEKYNKLKKDFDWWSDELKKQYIYSLQNEFDNRDEIPMILSLDLTEDREQAVECLKEYILEHGSKNDRYFNHYVYLNIDFYAWFDELLPLLLNYSDD